uniref:Calponin-homology (CH) domain-containing protein n=1 Tax=Knipowitschia caucasica TaxID=637954 RepID=A0AAV2KB72_KNICA
MNVYLSRREPPAEVHNLCRDLQDGRLLMMLLEELTGCKLLYRFRPASHRIFRLNNISKAIAFLDDRHVKLLGIDASAVADGVVSVVLHLIWNIILHFQVKEMTGGLRRRLSSSLTSLTPDNELTESLPNTNKANCHKYHGKTIRSLLQWVQRCTAKFGVEVFDFGRSWRSGLAFLALIKSLNPDSVDLRRCLTKEPEENLEQAFRIAQQSLDIPPLLEPKDVTCSYPDEKSIITYVSLFLRHCPDMVVVRKYLDLSAAASSPQISKFRSLETLADTEEAQPVFSRLETSHELLLWKRWARHSSNNCKSSSGQQPPSPLDATVANPEICSWLNRSQDRGYTQTKANEIRFSLSSEEGIYSLNRLDSDEEDAYSYILDLNEDVSKIQAQRKVPRVKEECEESSPISDKQRGGFFANARANNTSGNYELRQEVIGTDIESKRHGSNGGMNVPRTTELQASAMTLKRKLAATSNEPNGIELHILLFLWMLLYCYFIGHETLALCTAVYNLNIWATFGCSKEDTEGCYNACYSCSCAVRGCGLGTPPCS